MGSLTIRTTARCEMVDITEQVAAELRVMGVRSGSCGLFVPHTTAAITINENADPDVPRDMLDALARIAPFSAGYRHGEGNAAAHVKASLFGASLLVFVEGGRPVLGRWQSIFFCEFDGPRTRTVLVRPVAA